MSRRSKAMLLAAAFVIGAGSSAGASGVRFLVDTETVLAGDWLITQVGPSQVVFPDTFAFLPFSDSPFFEQLNGGIVAGISKAFDGVATVISTFGTYPDSEPPADGMDHEFAALTDPGAVPPVEDQYINSRAGPTVRIDFFIMATDFGSRTKWAGRFCFAAPGGLGGEFSGARCNAVIDNALAAIPVPAALPLAATGLALLGGLGWRRRLRR